MPTYTFSNFPNAIVTFGGTHCGSDYEKLQENLAQLKKLAVSLTQALNYGANKAAQLAKPALYAGQMASVITVLSTLVGEVDRIHQELKNLEQRVFSTILDGKLRALKCQLENLRSEETSQVQKVAEIVSAITLLNELLPLFANEDSIFRKRYYIGAPMFVHFCGILKAICLIAEQTQGYNTANLPTLKEDYQKMLGWYRNRCIGRRLASCYVKAMLAVPGCAWAHDWRNHYKRYSNYYEDNSTFPWIAYSEDLGGKGWSLWCGSLTYCNLIDLWDTRPYKKVTFERLEIPNTSDLIVGFGVGAAAAVAELQYHRDVLAEYRRRVEEVMIVFFDSANVTDNLIGESK